MSTLTIDVNLWGKPSEELGEDLKNINRSRAFVILVVQNARVGYCNGKVINITTATRIDINPCIHETKTLRLRGEIPPCLHPDAASNDLINERCSRMTITSILQRMSVALKTIETTITSVLRFMKDDPDGMMKE